MQDTGAGGTLIASAGCRCADAWAKVSLVGIELLSIEARVVIASVETYLKYAEAIGLTAAAANPA